MRFIGVFLLVLILSVPALAGTPDPPDNEQAEKITQVLGNPDNSEAYSIGNMYEEGKGVTKDHAKALKWYIKALDSEITAIAEIFGRSDKLPDDRFKAYILIRRAMYFDMSRFSVDPGTLYFEAGHEILAKYEQGLTHEQITKAKIEVPTTAADYPHAWGS